MKKINLFLSIIFLLASCSKKNDGITSDPKSDSKTITKFVFAKADNPMLTEDVEGIITGNEIKVVLHNVAKTSLKPTITHVGKSVNNDGQAKDFTNPVTYTITAEDGSTSVYTVTVDSRDVYISGYEKNANGNSDAVYWKNGSKIKLTVADAWITEKALAITVNGNDVYVLGDSYSNATNRGKVVYWKNGVKVEVTDGSESCNANAISVVGNDVYISGHIYNANTLMFAPVYWKNGVKTDLSSGSFEAITKGLVVYGTDVYVFGASREAQNQHFVATYWKNGTKIKISDGYAHAITMIGNDIYLAGRFNQKAVYWKNGVLTELISGYAYSIANSDNDFYIAGAEENIDGSFRAVYWKNGAKIQLTDGVNPSFATHIACMGTDVYIIGKEDKNGSRNFLYWFNGKPAIIANVAANSINFADINSIFIKSN